jgi:hypothetical protein
MNQEKEKPLYDLELVYDEQISPLMTQIIAICKEHRMPMLASFQYQRDEDNGEAFCTTSLPFEERGTAETLTRAMSAMAPKRPRMSTVTVIKADGSKEVTMIADLTNG